MCASHARAIAGCDARQPLVERRRAGRSAIADVDADVLVELGADRCRRESSSRVRRVGLEVAGDAIVEAHAERDQQVGFLNRRVHPRLAVHAHHAEVERMRRRERRRCRAASSRSGSARARRSASDRRARARQHDAVAGEDQRPLGGVDQRDRVARRRRRPAARRRTPRRGAARPRPSRTRSVACCASLVMSTSTGPGPARLARPRTPRGPPARRRRRASPGSCAW